MQLLTDEQVELLCRWHIHGAFASIVHLQEYGGNLRRKEAVSAMIVEVDAAIAEDPNPAHVHQWKTHFETYLKRMASNTGIDPTSFDVDSWARRGASRIRNTRGFYVRMAPLSQVAMPTDSFAGPQFSQDSSISIDQRGDLAVAKIGIEGDPQLPQRTMRLQRDNGHWLISRLNPSAEMVVPANSE